jgi:replication factor C subunit 3/5
MSPLLFSLYKEFNMFNSYEYEPKTVDDLVFADEDTRERISDYAEGRRGRHVVLHGPRGTGKSSAARVISETRWGPDGGIFNAPYEGSIFKESDFDKILNEWNWQRLQGVKKPVTVINEIDLLSSGMLEKLKSFMDQFGKHGQIIGTTNSEHKLSGALQDRFDIIEMPALPAEAFAPRVREIVQAKGYKVSEDAVLDVLSSTTGSWRDALAAAEDLIMELQR